MRRKVVLLIIGALVATVLGGMPTASADPKADAGPTVYVGELTHDQLKQVSDVGLDREELVNRGRVGDKVTVEVILTRLQAAKLKAVGLEMAEKKVAGATVSKRLSEANANGYTVWRSYSEPGGIRDEMVALSKQYPGLTRLVSLGKTVQGQDILAVPTSNTRTIDLSGATAAQAPRLRAQLSFDTEEAYDHVIVEAHPVGSDDWTTLPEVGGVTTTDVPADCEQGFLLEEHPFLEHYLTPGNSCTATGTTDERNAMSGSSDNWQAVAFDLSAYAGQQVEVSISYVTDPSTGGVGVAIDDTSVVVGAPRSPARASSPDWAPGRSRARHREPSGRW